ncbi:DUF2007 domain-containing protein [Marinicella rhabdoformis]|uniref:putative signal transducing protein n=1 Tax=Marinicella rhabdoformis TaxID=2580566 RepID=UPI0012AED8CD|nr:DUF2007 domain-containing protein [Marinicella rhabdoformis]
MIHLKTSEHITELMPLKTALELENIDCFIKNEFNGGGLGEIPFTETWPELWIKNESDKAKALSIIESFSTTSEAMADWDCPECHERIEREFQLCWQCGHVLAVE